MLGFSAVSVLSDIKTVFGGGVFGFVFCHGMDLLVAFSCMCCSFN